MNYFVSIHGCTGRQCLAVSPKEKCCGDAVQCSCRGRCTLSALDFFIKWMADVASTGIVPPKFFDDVDWVDSRRAAQRTHPFLMHGIQKVRFAMLELRLDWGEASGGLGFGYSNQERPCWFCEVPKRELHSDDCLSRFPILTHATYMRDISTSLIEVQVSQQDARRIFDNLRIDRRESELDSWSIVLC